VYIIARPRKCRRSVTKGRFRAPLKAASRGPMLMKID
jgi:hypothetical protein